MVKKIKVSIDGKDYLVEVDNIDSNPVRVIVNGDEIEVYTDQLKSIDKKSIDEKPSSKTNTNISVNEGSGGRTFYSPMPGSIISVAVKEGDQVITGDDVCILEAMKMQQRLKAAQDGVITKIHVEATQRVQAGAPLIDIEPANSA